MALKGRGFSRAGSCPTQAAFTGCGKIRCFLLIDLRMSAFCASSLFLELVLASAGAF
jgi:hypothetical protein